MEEFDKALAKLTESLTTLANTHGSEAVELTLEVARLHAIYDIVSAVIVAIISGILFRVFYANVDFSEKFASAWREMWAPLLTGISGFTFIFSILSIFYIPAWVGMFNPKIYLAYKMMGKIIN